MPLLRPLLWLKPTFALELTIAALATSSASREGDAAANELKTGLMRQPTVVEHKIKPGFM